MDKFKGRYRIPSARWATWDYGANAAYFITICTARRIHFFGEIADGAMIPTTLGQAAVDCWQIIPAHFPFVLVDASVVMPNHVHGIVMIDKHGGGNDRGYGDGRVGGNVGGYGDVVETQDFASLQKQMQTQPPPPRNRFGPQWQNLASIVRGYKIGVTKYARQNDMSFSWQPRYHDHIIRTAAEQERIRQYILTNPQQWTEDQLHS